MKNRGFVARLGFALAGIRIVMRRERSFRTQLIFALGAIAALALLRPGWVWAAIFGLAIALVLALEMMNAAIEYLIDQVHPEIAEEIKFAKDAAAGAVLIASLASLGIAGLMLAAVFMP